MYNLHRLNKYVLRTTYYVLRTAAAFCFYIFLIFIINASFFPYTFELVLRRLKKTSWSFGRLKLVFFMLKFIFNYLLFIPYTFFIIAHCAFNLNKNFFDATLSAAVGCIPLRKCLKEFTPKCFFLFWGGRLFRFWFNRLFFLLFGLLLWFIQQVKLLWLIC